MVKPDMPNMPPIPGMASMTDSLEFVKKLWGGMGVPGMTPPGGTTPGIGIPGMQMPGMNIPGMVMPTLSVEEINKKITDLKAVESWLALNMNMLRGTIQALEVQAATISALHSMGETFNATMNAAGMSGMGGMPGMATDAGSASASAPGAAARTSADADTDTPHDAHKAPQPTPKDEQDAANLTAPLVNAAAWWSMLQNQFQQAVSGAMAAEPEPESASKSSAAASPKSRSKTTSTATTNGTRKKTTKR